MYCSESCLNRAFNSYHRIECQLLQPREIREYLDVDDCMALRMLLIGTDQGAGLSTLMKKLTIWDIFAENIDPTDKPFTSDYLSILRLRRTFDKPLLNFTSNPGLIVKIIIALQDQGYFNSDPNQQNVVHQKRLSEMELFTALLLFNHMVSVKTSSSLLGQFYDYEFEERFIGRGLSILHTMINHSCDPNTEILLRGRDKVMFAVRPISKGEQIFTIYTDETFMFWTMETRADYLSRKFRGSLSFTCQCEACINKWPTHELMRLAKPKYLVTNPKKVKKSFVKMMLPVTSNRIYTYSGEETLQFVGRLRKWFHANVERPSMVTSHCELILRLSMKNLYDSTMPRHTKDGDLKDVIPRLMTDILVYFDHTSKMRISEG